VPSATPAPRPATAPRAPAAFIDQDYLDRAVDMAQDAVRAASVLDQDTLDRIRDQAQEARDRAREALDSVAPRALMNQDAMDRLRDQTQALRDQAQAMRLEPDYAPTAPARVGGGMGTGFGSGMGAGAGGGMNFAYNYNFNMPTAFAQSVGIAGRRGMSDDRIYDAGLRALDSHKWDEALEDFNQVAAHAGARADGGWYWKAYTLNRLGRRDEALAAIAELRKSYATSRWLDEAKALEIQVRQEQGHPVSPEAESDEELKLMALNGIMQSDPERAIPLVENILKGSGSHRLKAQALYVLAQSNTPRGTQVIEQIARGGGNPDLQLKAIEYLGQRRRQSNNNQNQLLMEIYSSSNDVRVKSAILDAFRNSRDYERLTQIAKSEKNPDLREKTFNPLGDVVGQPELWQLYQAETSPELKMALLRVMQRNGNADKLVEVIKTEKDPNVRRTAINVLATQETGSAERLVSIYGSEQDLQLRQAIVDSLSNQRNVKYLIELARAEKDTKLKLRIVERLSGMHSKEAADYLAELLK
jgi:tetratricopeptide (TPR) repeat protein